jgi:hypothetical protein
MILLYFWAPHWKTRVRIWRSGLISFSFFSHFWRLKASKLTSFSNFINFNFAFWRNLASYKKALTQRPTYSICLTAAASCTRTHGLTPPAPKLCVFFKLVHTHGSDPKAPDMPRLTNRTSRRNARDIICRTCVVMVVGTRANEVQYCWLLQCSRDA